MRDGIRKIPEKAVADMRPESQGTALGKIMIDQIFSRHTDKRIRSDVSVIEMLV